MGEPPEFTTNENNDAPRLRPEADALRQLMEILRCIPAPKGDEEFGDEDTINSVPVVRRVANALMTTAIAMNATDVRILSQPRNLLVRARVDGRPRSMVMLPRHIRATLFNRFKVMADIAFWRHDPQHVVIRVNHNNQRYNVVVQTTEAHYGDCLTLRIMGDGQHLRGLARLGMAPETHAAVEDAVSGSGLVLLVGPPDSGKTITAYTLLNKLNDVQSTVASVEDAPSYHLAGIVQTYRSEWPAHSSAQVLVNSLVQQRADVLFCGDLTDSDMANAALTAAENGVLTLACVTAPSVTHALLHLLRLGVEREQLAAVLSGTLYQTLGGALCPDCRETVPFDAERRTRLMQLFGSRYSTLPGEKPAN